MKKTQSNLVLKSSLAPPRFTSIAIDISPFISNNNKRPHYSALFLKIFSAFIIGLFLFTSCKKDDLLSAPPEASQNNGILKASGLTYYVDLSGNDATGNGSAGAPWKSLYKACQSVTVSGSVIHINAGTYVETNQCNLAPGVSIEGAGITSVIKSRYKTTRGGNIIHGSIALVSSAEGTNGNQSISNLKLDGDNLAGSIGIVVKCRNNVKIHDLTIVNFYINGITFTGASGGTYSKPTLYSTGNQVYNCSISNCGDLDTTWDGGAILQWSGQDGLLVHNNIFKNTTRTQGHNGNIVNASYYAKGVKYYNNKSYKPDFDGAWNFHIESWNNEGGMEIYNNEFFGGDIPVDIAGPFNTKGNYAYSTSVHDNIFRSNPSSVVRFKSGVHIEAGNCSDVIVYNNHFINLPSPITIADGGASASKKSKISIYNNLLENCTRSTSGIITIKISNNNSASVWSDINIYNSTILSDPSKSATAIQISIAGSLSNVIIKNNIILRHTYVAPIDVINNGKINGLHIDNNLIWNSANGNNPKFSGNAVLNYTFLNTIKSDPKFISTTDFHLQSGSPAIDAGINVGLLFNGIRPDLGAFESISGTVANLSPVIQNQSFQLNENSPINTVACKIIASDPDAGQTLTYSILSGNNGGAFAINASTGALAVANSAALNFSTTPSFSLIVKAQDNGSGPLSKQATVTVSLINVSTGSATGKITYQKWNNLGSSALVSALTGNINYPNKPSSTIQITSMEATTMQGENFGSRISGYIYAQVSGSYTFWIASDNNGELWLSTNDQPASRKKIAYHTSATGSREWNKYTTQKSVKINMVKGQKYYIEALMKEAYGGDNLAVGWLKPGQSGSVPSQIIPGSVLSPR